MVKQPITIINKLGLHARAAAKFVTLASKFKADIELSRGKRSVNGKSIMGIMLLAASKGTDLEITAEGADETEAVKALCELVNNRFDEGE